MLARSLFRWLTLKNDLAYSIKLLPAVGRRLGKLDKSVAKRILRYLETEVIAKSNPRRVGKTLAGEMAGLWRYRVGDYRVLAKIEDQMLLIVVVDIDHRKQVYR